MARVTGIGGVFFLSSASGTDLSAWYKEHLGMAGEEYGPGYHENGTFAWIMDPEGNKVELWEPKAWDEANKR